MNRKILLVDDQPNFVDSLERQLSANFEVSTAFSGKKGLELIKQNGPYAVVVSDMQMPEMNGVQFLEAVQNRSPETVRLMLTGNQDLETAERAVNRSNIFRFLTKPCSVDDLSKAIADALTQHKLITAEKDLLENTLSGSIAVLTDILTMVDPISFRKSERLRDPIRLLVHELGEANPLHVELAAMLLDIGSIILPPVLAARFRAGAQLNEQEKAMVARIPENSKNLISNIPRLEEVAKIIYYQNKNFDGSGFPQHEVKGEKIPLGSRIIRILKDLTNLEELGIPTNVAFTQMVEEKGKYDPRILKVAATLFVKPDLAVEEKSQKVIRLSPRELCPDQELYSNVETIDGLVLVTGGTKLTQTLIERIKNYATLIGVKQPVEVVGRKLSMSAAPRQPAV